MLQTKTRTGPPASEVRLQLQRILESDDFRGSERLQRFLEFVVEAELTGKIDRIKAYTLGVEVFERGDDFDPQADSIVRVEAGRLRRHLDTYYLRHKAEPVLIEVPKGGYTPRFSYSSVPGNGSPSETVRSGEPPLVVAPTSRKGLLAPIGLGMVLGLTLGLGAWWWFVEREGPVLPSVDDSTTNGGVTRVMVMPFSYATDTDPHPLLNESMVNELITTLATLPRFEVMALGTAKEAMDQGLTPIQIAERLGVDYLLQGDVRQQRSDLRVTLTIVDASTSIVRDSRVFEGTFDEVFDLQDEMARGFARSVAAAESPAFEQRIRATKQLDPEVMALYYEATTLRDPPSDPTRSRLAEEAYRRVIQLDPEFAGGYAGLSYVLAFRSWWKVGGDPEANAQAALEAGYQAVRKDPESGRAQMSLAIALNITGDHAGALEAARRAADLARDDPYVLTFSALVLTFQGEVEAAVPLAETAIRLDPLSPRTPFRNILGAILFQAGRYQESIDVLQENLQMGGPDGPHVSYWRAGSLAALGRTDEARRELEKARLFTGFDMRDFLAAFRDPAERGKLLATLEPLQDV